MIEVPLRTYINILPFSTGMACFRMVGVEIQTPFAEVTLVAN